MRKKEWRRQTERKHKQDRNEDRMRRRHRWGAGRDSKRKKKKEAKALALSWQFLSHGREDVSSHAPVVRLKNLGLLHSIQQSNSTHGCLVGRELVIPPIPSSACACSFHILFFHTTSICILLASITPVFPGHHVTRKQAAPFCSSCKTQAALASGEASRCWKSNAVLSSRIGRSRSAWAIPLVTEVRPQSWGKEMNSDSLMDLINQQVSNGNTQTCVMTEYTR